MNRLRTTLFALALLSASPTLASEVGSSRRFGLGLALGAPTGVDMKYFFSPRHAIEAVIGVGFFGGSGLSVHVDYKATLAVLTRQSGFELPLYLGVGVRFGYWFSNGARRYWGDKHYYGSQIGLGVRVPWGIAFHLNKVPVDVFLEIAPGLGVVPGVGVFIEGAVGARYYF